jgi:hypothetical protein
MDSSFYLFLSVIFLIIGLLLAFAAWTFFRRFQNLNERLKRSAEMTGAVNGSICELVTVYRRNRSFRWKNEYPILAYVVGGKEYKLKLDFAEKRMGHYSTGGSYQISYLPSDPSFCIAEDFRKNMNASKKSNLIATVLLAFFACNLLVSSLMQLLGQL